MAYKHKEDQAKAARKHYLANTEKLKARAKRFTIEARIRNRKFVWDYKSKHPCIDCGNANPIVLDFDHIDDNKEKGVALCAGSAWSIERILKEMKKCEIVCSNCHRIRTYNRRINVGSSNSKTMVS